MTAPPPYDQRVEVIWHDASSIAGWLELGDLDPAPCVVRQVGYVVPNARPGHLTLTSSFTSTGSLGDVSYIPREMVRAVRDLDSGVTLPVEQIPHWYPNHL